MKKIYFLVVIAFWLLTTSTYGQVASYIFSQTNGSYTPVTGGTIVGSATNALPSGSPESATMDDFTYTAVPIPFTFNFNGSPYTSLNINTNGWVSFGATGTSTSTPISDATAYNGVISPFANDLMGIFATTATTVTGSAVLTAVGNTSRVVVGAAIQGTGIPTGSTILAFDATTITISAPATANGTGVFISFTTGEIRIETLGAAPNRIFVIQFKGMAEYSTSTGTTNNTSADFQIRLSEAGGVVSAQFIDIVYGTVLKTAGTRTYQVGLRGLANTDFKNRTTTTDWAASTAGTLSSATMAGSPAILPASGLTFTFVAPVPPACPAPFSVVISTITSVGANVAFSGSGSSFIAEYGATGFTPGTGATAGAGGTIVTGTASPIALSGLTPSTAYQVYVRQNCTGSGNGFSANTTVASFTTLAPPPANDNICGAFPLTVNASAACSIALTGQSSQNATQSLTGCAGTADEDIWYSFVATSTSHIITLTNSGTGATDRVHQVFSSSDNTCSGTLTSISCSDPETSTLTGLTVGNTYFVRVYSYTSTLTSYATFDICVTTPLTTYISSTTTQSSTAAVTAGTVDQQIVRLQVVVNGTLPPLLTMSQINFTTAGSTNPLTDITAAKVYYTGTSTTFSTTTPFGTAVVSPNGNFSVNGSQVLTGGSSNTNNYFWLVYDVACSATVTDVVDAQVLSFNIGTAQIPTVTDPTGTRSIAASVTSATTNQPSTALVITGATDAQVLRVALASCSGATVNSIDFATTGSTNAATDIAAARVYYTTTTTFSNAVQFGTAVTAPNGAFTVTGSQVLTTGLGYFWLVYDVQTTATPANVIDAACTSSNISGNAVVPATPNPTGTRAIIAALVNDVPSGAIALTVGATCTGGSYTNVNATLATTEPRISCKGSQTAGSIVWFKFIAPASGFVKVSTDISGGTLTDTRLGLFSATDVNNNATFSIIACDDDNGATVAATSILYANGLIPGTTYYVGVDQWNGAGTGTFCVEVNDMSSAMLATATSCTAGQDLSAYLDTYHGWLSLTDVSGKLVAMVRNPTGTGTGNSTYTNSMTINSGAVRQSAQTLAYYLDRNFRITNATVTNADIQFFFLSSEMAALTTADGSTLNQLAASRQTEIVAGCQANFLAANGIPAVLPQTGNGSANGISWITVATPGFSNFYLNNVGTVLPVSIEYFKGSKQNGRNLLDWKVSCYSSPSLTMELERSTDGRSFRTITSQTETATRCLQPFSFIDNAPLPGLNYYRLKSVDVDGKINYSNIVALLNKDKGFEIVSLVPNPVRDEATLSVTSATKSIIEIVVTDLSGKQLSKQRISLIAGNNLLPLDVRKLPAGSYQVTGITEDGASRTLRFVKQ